MRVLILDANSNDHQNILAGLSGEDFEIIEVSDGDKGLEIIAEQRVNILIASYSLEGFPGPELVSAILAIDSVSPPFVIFIVEEETQQEVVEALASLSGDYLTKPISPDDLRARMAIVKRSITMQERTDRVRQESETIALYDVLTGMFNRQVIYDHGLAEISRSQREGHNLSIAMVEINNLAEIEKQHGNEIRDQVLRYVSSAIRANVRIYDLLGRWIGAKFLLMLPNTNLEDASTVIKRVNESISAIGIPLPDHSSLAISVRFGVSSLPSEGTMPFYQLVEHANEALQQAKNESERQVVFFEG